MLWMHSGTKDNWVVESNGIWKLNFFIGRTLNLENVHMGFILGGFKLDGHTQVVWSMCGFFGLVFPFLEWYHCFVYFWG